MEPRRDEKRREFVPCRRGDDRRRQAVRARKPSGHVGSTPFKELKEAEMSDEKDAKRPEKGSEPITAGPWSSGIAAVIRVRWTEPLALGTLREKVFATIPEAEEFKRELEAKGFEVTIG
jgi:hypothetical protein